MKGVIKIPIGSRAGAIAFFFVGVATFVGGVISVYAALSAGTGQWLGGAAFMLFGSFIRSVA